MTEEQAATAAAAAAPAASPSLSLRGLTVRRGGRPVVLDLALEIPAGEITALLGPNGAGKSSLVLAVGGVLRCQAGSVLLGENDLANRRPERIRQAGVAIVPEAVGSCRTSPWRTTSPSPPTRYGGTTPR